MSGIPAWAVHGAKVVCIDQIIVPSNEPTPEPPVPDRIYTIAATKMFGNRPSAQFEEIHPLGVGLTTDGRYWENNTWWALRAFRPLVSTKSESDDIADHFNRLLWVDPIVRLDYLLETLDQ